jgi:hypothetical protein
MQQSAAWISLVFYNRRRISPASTFYEGGGFYLRTSVPGINSPPTEAPGVC